jgi:formylglycine-generating enzyme required for sulfatase activity
MPVLQACAYIRQAALGLQHAHERGLVHRDIKPHNLIMSVGDGLIKVADLGLARLPRSLNEEVTAALTSGAGAGTLTPQNAALMGTADYLAPEQALDFHRADIRADIYSLGCTMYYLLTGQPPFPGSTLAEKLLRHQQAEPPPLEQLRADVPAGLSAVVGKMLAKRPEDRYQTPGDLAAELSALLKNGPQEPRGAGGSARLWKALSARRRWLLYGLVILLAVAAVALFGSARGPARRFTNSIGMELVLIPPGNFTMGSPDSETGHMPQENGAHEVAISKPFYLGVHEVTVGNFHAFAKATGYQTEAEKGGGAIRFTGDYTTDPKCNWQNPGWAQGDDHPVVAVSWNDATAFCQWLSKKEGKTYRLPTEAEWEYACRAGTKTPFHFGSALSAQHANFNAAIPYGPAPKGPSPASAVKVGSYAANDIGLYDMHGNVWELCADYYDGSYYSRSPKSDPTGPETGTLRVLRGGSWCNEGRYLRSAFRQGYAANQRGNHIGFRVACDVKP